MKTLKNLKTVKHIPPYFVFYLFTWGVFFIIVFVQGLFIPANMDCYVLRGVAQEMWVLDENECDL